MCSTLLTYIVVFTTLFGYLSKSRSSRDLTRSATCRLLALIGDFRYLICWGSQTNEPSLQTRALCILLKTHRFQIWSPLISFQEDIWSLITTISVRHMIFLAINYHLIKKKSALEFHFLYICIQKSYSERNLNQEPQCGA